MVLVALPGRIPHLGRRHQVTRQPNAEQDAIVEASKDRSNLISAAALAGTGKTTTMVSVAEANPYATILYIAYNRSTKDEAKQRFPRQVRVVTSHGLAYGSIGKEFGQRLNARQPKSRQAAQLMGLPAEQRFTFCVTCDKAADAGCASHAAITERMQGWRIASLVKKTLERFCYSAFDLPRQRHAGKCPQGLDERVWPLIRVHVTRVAIRVWKTDLQDPEGKLWFWPDIYLKMYQLTRPRLSQRIIILDEAQDTNDCVWGIISSQSGKQIILVGDSNQMIYEWRGSKDVMELLEGAVKLSLTGSYRFPQVIADEANHFLDLLGVEDRLRGLAPWDGFAGETYEGDSNANCAIYRTNAGCISGAMAGLEIGLKVAIVGGGAAIRYLAEAARDLQAGRSTDHPELIGFENWEQVLQYIKEEPEDAGTLVPIVNAITEYGPARIIDMTNRLVDEGDAEFTVTTCHKAKGREWNHIIIGDDFPQPVPGREPRREELRLAYVAVTRGKEVVELGSLAYARQGL